MFCALPSPFKKWDEEAKKHMLVFLPAVGLFIGAIWTAAAYVLNKINTPTIITAAVLTALPFLLTGGIHFDGFLDVSDALKSYRPREERIKILKDPHTGSFATLAAILLIMIQFALLNGAKPEANIFSLLLIPVVSRTMASLCVSTLKPIETSEYNEDKPKATIIITSLILGTATALGFIFLKVYGFVSAAVIAGYLIFLIHPYKAFKGISGDVSGYAMTISELCGIAVFALL